MEAPRKLSAVVILALAGAACGPARDPATSPAAVPAGAAATPAAPSPDVERVEMLPTPFTAEQIRAEWVEGLRLTMRRWALTGERLERLARRLGR
jgi:hypothetical protein